MNKLANVIGFQLVWCAAVGGAARGWWWAGPVALLVFAALQLALSADRRTDLLLLALSAVLGFAVDSLWVLLDWMQFRSPVPFAGAAPIWIVAMWMSFALTLNHSLVALRRWPLWSALFGVIGGPLAYWIAMRAWDAVAIAAGAAPYIGLAVAWGLLTPLLLKLAERLAEQRRLESLTGQGRCI